MKKPSGSNSKSVMQERADWKFSRRFNAKGRTIIPRAARRVVLLRRKCGTDTVRGMQGERVSFYLWCEFDMPRPQNATVLHDSPKKGAVLLIGGKTIRGAWDCYGGKPYSLRQRALSDGCYEG